jgi:hypothetical protein
MKSRLLVALAVLTIVSVPGCTPQSESRLRVGEEIMTFDLADVLELSYRSPTVRMIAHRWTVNDPFILTVERVDDRAVQRCEVPPHSEELELLRSHTTFRVNRVVQNNEAEQLARSKPRSVWAEFVIRDGSDLDPARLLIVPTPTKADELFARLPDSREVVTIESKPLGLLEHGCSSTANQ